MAFPEWGNSYNALYVPLTSDWQCALVPAREVQDVDRGWKLSYEERQRARNKREEQIEQDRQDFDRLFRVSISRRAARACSDFRAYAAFIREHLRISGLAAPADGEDVTRILRDAVRDGQLVPGVHRAWRGSRRVARPYGPQIWPNWAPDPMPAVHALRDGQFIPLDADGRMIDRTPYVPIAAKVATIAGNAASSDGGADWLGVVGEMTGALLVGGSGDSTDAGDGAAAFNDSTPLGDAQPFDYQSDMPDGDAEQLAARGVRMTGNEPGSFSINPKGQDVDYFDSGG